MHGEIATLETCFDFCCNCDCASDGFNAEAIALAAVTTAPVRVDWIWRLFCVSTSNKKDIWGGIIGIVHS